MAVAIDTVMGTRATGEYPVMPTVKKPNKMFTSPIVLRIDQLLS